jgi:hypothetical protein
LQQTIENSGKSYDDYGKQIEQAIKHQEKFGNTANQTQDALRILTQATGDPAKALEYLGTASDLAAAKHEDLSSAAQQLGKTYNGTTRLLKEFGIEAGPKAATATKGLESATKAATSADDAAQKAHQKLSDVQQALAGKSHLTAAEQIRLRDAVQNAASADEKAREAHAKLAGAHDAVSRSANTQSDTMTALSRKLHGEASAAADTFGGHIKEIKAKLEDAAASLGQKYGPALTGAGAAIGILGSTMTVVKGIVGSFSGAQKGAAAATDALAASEDAEAASSWAALGPVLLIVAAIGALIFIAWLLYQNWDKIWKAIKEAAKAVWDWIHDNWPLLLEILTGPIGWAVLIITRYWGAIKQGARDVWQWIQDGWNHLVDFFVKMPGRITKIAKTMWDGIKDAFVSVIDAVIGAWNWLAKHLQVSIHIKGSWWHPGIDFDTGQIIPSIPTLAEGGLITSSGIVFAHAGEVISPIDKVPRGPVINIEQAQFNDPIDVELLSKTIAFDLTAGLAI